MRNEYESDLLEIQRMQKSAYRPNLLMMVLILCGAISQSIVAGLGIVFGVAAFLLFYKRIVNIAHARCPRCTEPFGTSAKYPLGVGLSKCQNCGLSL